MDSLLVVDTSLRPISHSSYCRLFVKFALLTGVPLFNTLVRGEP